ncbi:MAG: MFS transporter [Aliivibrio sp.]|uniref:MFS transporter n=1 Tax=Aliivibrio sp. TaxID=1872443 RepID=UPI001A5B150F|nr:MFS transporter [Aliivibrio sp.]
MNSSTSSRFLPWNVWLLALIQPFVLSVGAMNVFLGGIIGTQLTDNNEWVTLPVTALIVGVSAFIFPSAKIQQHIGRKHAFTLAALLSAFFALLAGYSIEQSSFFGYVISCFLLGTQLSFVGQYRFAAIESCQHNHQHPSAISVVLLGGISAAIVGPELLNIGHYLPLFTNEFSNAYIALAVIELIGATLLWTFMKPLEINNDLQSNVISRPLTTIFRQKMLWLALASGITAYAVMAFLMTATPLAMQHHGHDIQSAKWVIQSHVLAMYLPSLFTAVLIRYVGLYRLITIGSLIMLTCIGMGLMGHTLHNYWLSLVLLGIGWNFMFICGTTLLAQTYRAGERFKVQAINDFSITAFQASGSLGAGFVLFSKGWEWMLLVSILPVSVLLLANFMMKKQQN